MHLAAAATLGASSCGRGPALPTAEPCATTSRAVPEVPPVELVRTPDRPRVATVVRDGDPAGAVAAVLLTAANAYASSGLSALLEARLRAAGVSDVDARADRDGARVRALVDTPEEAAAFVAALRAALAKPVGQGDAEIDRVHQRWASLRRHPFEAPIAASVASCTGALGALSNETVADATAAEGAARLDEIRRAVFGVARVAFGVVGPSAMAKSVAAAVQSSDAWPAVAFPDAVSAPEERAAVFASAAVPAGSARLVVAVATERAESAIAWADQAGDADGVLAARLRALPWPFRLVDATGVVRARGGCVAATLESARAVGSNGRAEDAAAWAAEVTVEQLELLRSAEGDRSDSAAPALAAEAGANTTRLSPTAARVVRGAPDPRDAADLAARWSLTQTASPDEANVALVALAVAPPSGASREALAAAMQSSSSRLVAGLARVREGGARRHVERRQRVERGQGELWLLLGSTCGTAAEGAADAGFAALGLTAALAARTPEPDGVTLEPWATADGLGVIAHAAPRWGESSGSFAARVAEQAARTLSTSTFSVGSFAAARGALLARLTEGMPADSRAIDALAGALAPAHPSWLLPLGSADPLARAGQEAVSLRWSDLVAGPLRLAVLSNEGPVQADAAALAADRWLARPEDAPRRCPAAEELAKPKPSTFTVALGAGAPGQALVAVPVPAEGTATHLYVELTWAALGGEGGWLDKALGSLGASAEARLWGGTRAAALVVEVRAAEANLDPAVAQVRALLQRLAQGAITQADLSRAAAHRQKWHRDAQLDPRRRLAELWREPPEGSKPSAPTLPIEPSAAWLEPWRAWVASNLQDERLVIVVGKPKR
jgi:hypothetical protein